MDGRERAVLLVEWLDELVFLAETEDLVPEDMVRIELSEDGLAATVRCRRGSPRHLVKAATYHRLAFEPSGRAFVRGWCSMSEVAQAGVRGFRQVDEVVWELPGPKRVRTCGCRRGCSPIAS